MNMDTLSKIWVHTANATKDGYVVQV